jgi:transcriptional regulator with XRE-family HTH domain
MTELGLTNRGLARMTGVSESAIRSIKTGRSPNPSKKTIGKLKRGISKFRRLPEQERLAIKARNQAIVKAAADGKAKARREREARLEDLRLDEKAKDKLRELRLINPTIGLDGIYYYKTYWCRL